MTSSGPEQSATQAASEAPSLRALNHWPSVVLFVGVVSIVVAGDLWIKTWAFTHVADTPVVLPNLRGTDPNYAIPEHRPMVVVPGLLDLKLTFNTGAVFGLGKGRQLVFILVSIAAVGVIVWSFAHSRPRSYGLHLAMALILAGALGNLYDRVRFNAVRDMFLLLPGTRLWPYIFNLADASLMVGMGILIVTLWLHDRQTQNASTDQG